MLAQQLVDFHRNDHDVIRLETLVGSTHLCATMCCLNVYHLLFNIQFSSDLVSVDVAPPSHINTSSNSANYLVLTDALCAIDDSIHS